MNEPTVMQTPLQALFANSNFAVWSLKNCKMKRVCFYEMTFRRHLFIKVFPGTYCSLKNIERMASEWEAFRNCMGTVLPFFSLQVALLVRLGKFFTSRMLGSVFTFVSNFMTFGHWCFCQHFCSILHTLPHFWFLWCKKVL